MGGKVDDVPNVGEKETACFSLLVSLNLLVKSMEIITLQ
jgi:hypothetical protein